MWKDQSLPRAARELLDAEYRAAYGLWRDVRYIRKLQAAVKGADARWATYTTARAAMDSAFSALATTPDTHWRAALSALVTAQEAATTAGAAWDDTAAVIAEVHSEFLHSDLGPMQAYRLAVLGAPDWAGSVEDSYDYVSTSRLYGNTPLARAVELVVTGQREHVKRIAEPGWRPRPVTAPPLLPHCPAHPGRVVTGRRATPQSG